MNFILGAKPFVKKDLCDFAWLCAKDFLSLYMENKLDILDKVFVAAYVAIIIAAWIWFLNR